MLRSGNNLDDIILEVPPTEGTLLAFRRSNTSWHGHKPFSGPRRVIQFNWVTSEAVVRREQNRHRFSAWMKKLRGAVSGEKKAAERSFPESLLADRPGGASPRASQLLWICERRPEQAVSSGYSYTEYVNA